MYNSLYYLYYTWITIKYQWRIQDFRRGCGPVRADMDPRRRGFLAKIHVKMKELGPVGGHALSMPPRSANEYIKHFS